MFDSEAREPGPRCSIVIPAHNRAGLTRACLDALMSQRPVAEIIVVDDGSSDATPELLASYGEAITVITRTEQGGFSRSCNAAAERARGEFLVLLNNDTMPTDGWLEALVSDAEAHPRAGIVGAKLLWPNNTVQHAGVVVDNARNALHVYVGFPAEHPAVNRSREFQIVTGAAMLIRREAWEQLEGFDESFVNGWEDVDLCLRAGAAGWKVRCCHESVLYHLEGATRGHDFPGDEPNWAIYRERWAARLRPDDIDHYVEDGLLELRYSADGLELTVAPELASVSGTPPGGLEQALRDRTRAAGELMRDYVRLAVADGEPVNPWAARAVPRPVGSADGSGRVSVIVPVSDHGHSEELVAELERQSAGRDGFEVILATAADRLGWEPPAGGRTRVVHADPSGGRAAAFNRGILDAAGELVLLLADDFIPQPGFLEEHLAVHAHRPQPQVAAIGPAFFGPSARTDPFARWIEDSGTLFGAPFATCEERLPGNFFWGANVSLKREFLLAGELFDERFPDHAWDDYELGLRLFERGLQVIYAPRAVALHEHALTLEERRRAVRLAGAAAARFDAKYPRGHRWNTCTDPAIPIASLAVPALTARLRGDRADYYKLTLRREFIRGYREAAWA